MHTYMYTYMLKHTCTYTYTHKHIYKDTQTQTHTCLHAHLNGIQEPKELIFSDESWNNCSIKIKKGGEKAGIIEQQAEGMLNC